MSIPYRPGLSKKLEALIWDFCTKFLYAMQLVRTISKDYMFCMQNHILNMHLCTVWDPYLIKEILNLRLYKICI